MQRGGKRGSGPAGQAIATVSPQRWQNFEVAPNWLPQVRHFTCLPHLGQNTVASIRVVAQLTQTGPTALGGTACGGGYAC